MSSTTDHIIIGGGVMGLLTAWFLAQEGQKVTLVERDETGKESSWAGGGILSPLYPWQYPQAVTELVKWSQNFYPDLAEQLGKSTDIDPEWTQSGLLILDADQQQQALDWGKQTDTELHIISKPELVNIEPKVNADFETAIWLPDVAQIRNPRLVKCLKQSLQQHNVEILEHSAVEKILTDNNRATGVAIRQNGSLNNLYGSNVLVTGGAWSAEIISPFGFNIDVEPVRGQIILLKTEPGYLKRIVLENGRYVIPRRDGHTLIGSTLEYVGFDKHITKSAKEQLLESAEKIIPSIDKFPLVKHWAGLRPGSTSNIPTICEHPTIENLFINAGHFRNGVVMAPASAKLLTQLCLRQETIFNPLYYNGISQE